MGCKVFLTLLSLSSIALAQSQELKFLQKEINDGSKISSDDYVQTRLDYSEVQKDTGASPAKTLAHIKDLQSRAILNDEEFVNTLENTLVKSLRTAFEKSDAAAIRALAISQITFSDIAAELKLQKADGISFGSKKSFSSKAGAEAFEKSLVKYLSQFKSIEYADAKVTEAMPVSKKALPPVPLFSDYNLFKINVALDLRGPMLNGKARSDKFELSLQVEKSGAHYAITQFDINRMQVAMLEREPAFKHVEKNAGLDAGKVYPRLEALRRGGYGLALEDFNNDGYVDAFVGNYGPSTLWLGQADGSFKELKSEEINKVTLAKAAAFVDLDNDGYKDLVVTRFAADNLVGDVILFKNDKGTFKEVKNAFPSEILRDYAMPMAIADFNNDGLLDIYIGFPGERDFSAGVKKDSKLATNGLFINHGHFEFADNTKTIENADGHLTMPHGAIASDFNMDGKIDIMIMDDQKNLSPLYQNVDNNHFVLKNESFKVMNYGYGMGIAAGDLNGDGKQDYVLSNATFNTQNRLGKLKISLAQSFIDTADTSVQSGIRVFLSNKNSTGFTEAQSDLNLTDSGEAAGGVTLVDYDNDGLLDVYVVNGLWSGSNRDEKIDSMFAKAIAMGIVNQNHLQDGKGDRTARGTKSIFMKVLMQDKAEDNKTLSFAGYQRNRLFKNLGNGQFIEVGYLEGIDSISDGYMSVVADINRDGKPDLVLRNCDPGAPDNMFAPVEVYQNTHAKAKGSFITLKGKKSNSMGVGAKLFATIGKKVYYREMFANNSAVQGEVSAHFGLGENSKISSLKVIWPSGIVNIYHNIPAGHHQLEEKDNTPVAKN